MTLLVTLDPLDAPFGWAPRPLIEDPSISWKAKGLWLYLNSRPQGWKVRMTDLVNRSTDGEKSIRTGIRELRDHGWMDVVRRVDRDSGKVQAWDWVLEIPDAQKGDLDQMPKTHHVDSPHLENAVHSNNQGSDNHGSSVPTEPLRVEEMTAAELLAAGTQAIGRRFMPKVRKKLRLNMPIEFPEENEISILRSLLESGVEPPELDDSMDGVALLRDHGALEWLPANTPCTTRVIYNTRSGATPLLGQAAHYARKRRERQAELRAS